MQIIKSIGLNSTELEILGAEVTVCALITPHPPPLVILIQLKFDYQWIEDRSRLRNTIQFHLPETVALWVSREQLS